MAARAILLLLETLLLFATKRIVMIFCRRKTDPRCRIKIGRTVFLSTRPTPGSPASHAGMKFVRGIQATGKNIRAGIVLETPPQAPRALFGIFGTFFWHTT
jgi:hypothetical protein